MTALQPGTDLNLFRLGKGGVRSAMFVLRCLEGVSDRCCQTRGKTDCVGDENKLAGMSRHIYMYELLFSHELSIWCDMATQTKH